MSLQESRSELTSRAIIAQTPLHAMQSGRGNVNQWTLKFGSETERWQHNVMGWTSSRDPVGRQIRLTFPSKETAIAFAEEHG